MKRAALLALLLALAACAVDAGFPDPRCRAAMYDDPEVRARMKATTSANANADTFEDLEEAKAVAYAKCMGVGKTGRGGVEKVR